MVAPVGAIGRLLVLGIGARLLEVADIEVINLVPALFIGAGTAGAFAGL